MTAWFLLIFGALQNIVMAEVVITNNETHPKDGVPVELSCISSSPVSCTNGFWRNKKTNLTLCGCHQGQCHPFGGDRYKCFINSSTVGLIITSFNQSLDNSLECQCDGSKASFEYPPTSNVTGPTTSQLPVDKTGVIVGPICGGLALFLIAIGVYFCRKKRNDSGEKAGNKKEQSDLGSAKGPQDFADGRQHLLMEESKSSGVSEDRRNSSDEEEIEMSLTYP